MFIKEDFESLRMRLLADMRERGASQDFCLTHGGIGWDGYVPRYVLSALLRSLKNDGLAFFMCGLWTDDGEMAGSGHGLTNEGVRIADRILGNCELKEAA